MVLAGEERKQGLREREDREREGVIGGAPGGLLGHEGGKQ
jgi:hypothetical protein